MDFETTFLKEHGVSYNPEAIADYTEKQAFLSLLLAANNRNKCKWTHDLIISDPSNPLHRSNFPK